jgi:hypothetical protein
MRKLIILFAVCALVMVMGNESSTAQVRFRVNISTQPIWGPTGYDNVQYYYLPDIETYYNVSQHRFVYMENNRWRSSTSLPFRYRNYDLYNTRRVVINERTPYLNHQANKARYASWNDDQHSIRDSRDSKYYVNRNHPEYSSWKNSQRNQRQRQHQNQRDENSRNRN